MIFSRILVSNAGRAEIHGIRGPPHRCGRFEISIVVMQLDVQCTSAPSIIDFAIDSSVRVVAACRKRFRGGERVCRGIASPFKIPRPTKVCAPIDFAAMEFLSYTLLRPNFQLSALHPKTIGSIYGIDT